MLQRLLEVRVRPFRIAILVNRAADAKDLLLGFELLSKVWGGRFGQVLAVDPETCDELTAFRLGESRPELVYGVGLNDEKWAEFTLKACQPRKYSRLNPEFVTNIRQADPQNYLYGHYYVDHALIHLMRMRDTRPGRYRRLRLVTAEQPGMWQLLCGAVFGVHHPTVSEEYRDEVTAFTANSATAFVALATEFVKEWQQSWLDVTGHKLNINLFQSGFLPPTVVIVRELVPDLSLFWNLRSASDADIPAWIIPIPETCMPEEGLLDALKAWLLAFAPYGRSPNYCRVISEAADEGSCREFADRLQGELAGTPFEAVDYDPNRNRFPVVIPFEYETAWAAAIDGRTLTIQPPKPKAFESLASPRSWVVDLRKDIKTGRAVGELQLPPGLVAFELLNGPCPPSFDHRRVARYGDGHDCINVHCTGGKEVVRIFLPTAEEVLQESLREYGVEPVKDEKRASYLPVIERFGGLYHCAKAFSGQSGSVLRALTDGTKTHPEIQSACRLGSGDLAGETYEQRVEQMLTHETDRMKRVARRRFSHHARHAEPENLKLRSLLEFWADRAILTRQWKLGPCGQCRQQYFVPSLNLQKRVVCTNCGHRITLPASVPVGYTLHRSVKHAISEGIVPVVQTGQFLRNLSSNGFLWLPGVKYKIDQKLGDIDVMACCDGHLVFCECKQLDQTTPEAKVWEEVVEQFLETVEIAKLCRGSLVVLATQVDQYPEQVLQRIAEAVGTKIPYLLLTKADLEKGRRNINDCGVNRSLWMSDLLSEPFPERKREKTDSPRTIEMGWGVYGH
jgi:DNA-directed RNA polymerase subunit RPC12/RpoP